MKTFICTKPHLAKIDNNDCCGILLSDELSRLHTDIGAEFDHATTLITYTEDIVPIRYESKVNNDKMRRSCVEFRKLCGDRACFMNDEAHAKLLLGQKLSDVIAMFQKDDSILAECELQEHNYTALDMTIRRYYVKYKCPYLGHIEYMFPIIINDYIIAVMFLGQFRTLSEKSIKEHLEDCVLKDDHFFLNLNFPNINSPYNEYNQDLPKMNRSIISKIVSSEKRKSTSFIDRKIDMPSDNELNDYISHIIKKIYEFEESLVVKHYENTKININNFFLRKKDYIFERLSSINDKMQNTDKLAKYWEVITEETITLFSEMQIGNIMAYGNQHYTESKNNSNQIYFSLIFDTSNSSNENITVSSLQEKALSKNYPVFFDNTYSEIEYTNSSDCNYISLLWPAYEVVCSIIFKLTPNDSFLSIDHNQRLFILDNILNLYSSLFSVYHSIWSLISRDHVVKQKSINEDALSIFSHEINQHTSALSRLYLNNFSSSETIKLLPNSILEKISEDFFSSVQMLDYIAKNSKVYLGIIKPYPTEFLAFAEKLFKFTKVFRSDAKEKNIYIKLPTINKNDLTRSELLTDKVLFEQILFNILRNAFQYSHPSTNILVDCKKDSIHSNLPHKLTVTNYGIQLDKSRDIYDMHVRGKNADEYFEKGTGIGLFVVKMIVEALGGKVEDDGEKCISQYNVPLIEQYLSLIEAGEKDEIGIEMELRTVLKDETIPWNKIINRKYNKQYGKSFIRDRITQSTWETTFTITIPRMEVKK